MLYLQHVKGSSIRNLKTFQLDLAEGINFFYGPNASGKTTILEAVYLLSRVKSFRSKRINDVISRGDNKLQVFAKGTLQEGLFTIGIEKGHGLTKLKFNGEAVQTASEQAKKFPVFLLTPEHQLLYTGTPKERRHWLDWSLFHVKQDYISNWKSYHRALRHRNALLKSESRHNSDEISGWEKLMSDEAKKLDAARQGYLREINTLVNDHYLPLVMNGAAEISYLKAEYEHDGLFKCLLEDRDADAKRGYTGTGPHRTDISFLCDNFNVAKHLSRGQTKLFGAALISAQLEHLKRNGVHALFLVDDLDAELDDESSKKMFTLLQKNNVQTLVSSLKQQDWLPVKDEKTAVFHVKHGEIEKC